MARITIGVPTYNGARRVDALFRSLARRTPPSLDWRVVLVDDGSPDPSASRDVARGWAGSLRLDYVEHGENKGIPAGWNVCARRFDCEYVVLINDDVMVVDRWLENILFALERNPQVGAVSESWHAFLPEDVDALVDRPELVVPRDPISKERDPSRRSFEAMSPGRVMAVNGHLFGFRREDYEAVGGFDEGYRSFYEEVDFGTALAAKLGKIGLQLNAPHSWHMWSATFGSNPELEAEMRMRASHARYCEKWSVPGGADNTDPFGYTNPTFLGAIGDVPVEWVRSDGNDARGVLRSDGAYVDA